MKLTTHLSKTPGSIAELSTPPVSTWTGHPAFVDGAEQDTSDNELRVRPEGYDEFQLFEMGEGRSIVYRAVQVDEKNSPYPWLLKRNEDTADGRETTTSDITTLHHLSAMRRQGFALGFLFPEARLGRAAHITEIQHIHGSSLDKVLLDTSIDRDIRSALLASYNRNIAKLHRFFMETSPQSLPGTEIGKCRIKIGENKMDTKDLYIEDIPIQSEYSDLHDSAQKTTIWVRPDNVIVESDTHKQYLVDPH